MNVILVIVDTLRYDYIGANGNDWIETPNLDGLAEGSWVFDRAFAASYPTIPHRTDVITGGYGSPFNPWMPLRFDAVALPRVLADSGYCTQLIHDTPHLVNGGHNFDWPFHAWTFVRGAEVDRPWLDDSPSPFLENWRTDDLYDFAGDPELQEKTGHVVVSYARANRARRRDEDWNAARLFRTAAKWLRDNSKRDRFFLWVDCFDPHEPWDAPPEFVLKYDKTPGYDGMIDPRSFVWRNDERLPEAAKERIKACYAAKVSWMDRWLGELLDALEETGLERNTAVILTADHGTCLAEPAHFGKRPRVWEQEGHVPLMVRAPGRGSGRTNMFVQPQDVFAAVCGVAGVSPPEGLDSYDVLALAERGQNSSRELALAGRSAHSWGARRETVLFTVFDEEWYLQFAARPEDSRLFRYGSLEDEAASNASTVGDLRKRGVDETERRGADPALVAWLRSDGEAEFPAELGTSPAPPGYRHYWQNNYNKW